METRTGLDRRSVLGLLAAPLLAPAPARAAPGGPVTIGILSDLSGPVRENGGIGSRVAAEMAVADFGGSVLDRPVRVIQADNQNKPDIASAIARQWIDEGVDVLADGATSAAALAIQQVTLDKKRIYLITSPATTALVDKQCSPYGFQFTGNTYAYTKAVSDSLTRQGGTSWFIIAWDYELGYAMQSSMEEFVRAAGGTIAGSTRAPVNTADYSSFLLQAQASGAKVIGLCIAGTDLQNCVKQAAEFGTAERGQLLATPILGEPDIATIGQDNCKGLVLSTSFYWDLSERTRTWSERFIARQKKPPTQYHAASYAGVLHWLKAVRSAGTLDADRVSAAMREAPVQDFYNDGIRFEANQSLPLTFYLCGVKATAQAKGRFDMYDVLATMASPQAYPPPALFGCALVHG